MNRKAIGDVYQRSGIFNPLLKRLYPLITALRSDISKYYQHTRRPSDLMNSKDIEI